MDKIIKIISIVLVAAIVVTAVFLGIFLLKPQLDIKKNRAKVNAEKYDGFSKNGDNIHFLSTGSSDCILIESNGKLALVDSGEDTDNPRGFEELELEGYEEKVLNYLKNNFSEKDGKVHLDFVLGTHAHSDHIGGFDTIINDKDIVIGRAYLKEYNESIINDHEVNDWDNKEVYTQMLGALNKKKIPVISDFKETEFSLGNFKITLLNTEYDNSGKIVGENDNSIGVLVEKDGRKVFLAADIDNNSGDEDRLAPIIGKVDVLKVGHHSYSGSTTSDWLRTLCPEICVVTNNYSSADKRTLRRISRLCSSPILLTGTENGVVVSFKNGDISLYNDIH